MELKASNTHDLQVCPGSRGTPSVIHDVVPVLRRKDLEYGDERSEQIVEVCARHGCVLVAWVQHRQSLIGHRIKAEPIGEELQGTKGAMSGANAHAGRTALRRGSPACQSRQICT